MIHKSRSESRKKAGSGQDSLAPAGIGRWALTCYALWLTCYALWLAATILAGRLWRLPLAWARRREGTTDPS